MAVTQETVDALAADVAGLERMLADGVRQVTLGGQTVTYNTTDSLVRARDDALARLRAAQAELAAGSSPVRRSRVVLLSQGDRGYH